MTYMPCVKLSTVITISIYRAGSLPQIQRSEACDYVYVTSLEKALLYLFSKKFRTETNGLGRCWPLFALASWFSLVRCGPALD